MGLVFYDSSNTETLLYISVVILVVLLIYLSRQEYKSSCDRRVDDLKHQYTTLKSGCGCVSNKTSGFKQGKKSGYSIALDRKIKQRKKPTPELDVMKDHSQGKFLDDNQQKIDDPLTLDGLLQEKNLETMTQQLNRSFGYGNTDGPQLEGMYAPIDEFERNAIKRQLSKRQEIYGDQAHDIHEADRLSELNI